MIHKKSLFHSPTGLMKKSSLLLLVLVTAVLLMTSTAMAEVTNLSYSPLNPSPGDEVTVSGTASPNEEISVSVSFEKIQSVSDGSYDYHIGKITIPPGSESFSLRAEGVDSLDITLYVLGQKLPSLPVTVNNGVATFGTSKITSGTYDIGVSGTSSSSEVTLSFGGKGSITTDSDGYFEYPYTTENMPEGNFALTVGGQTLSIPLGTTDGSSDDDDSSSSSSSSSSSTKKSSSHTGTDLQTVDAATLGNDEEESSGVGDEVEKILHNADMESTQDESSEGDSDTGEVDGYILENKSLSGIQSKIPKLGVMGAVVGVLCLGAIFIGFRKNRYK